MTQQEAITNLASRFEIGAVLIDFDYDPSGSTSSYEPNPADLDVIEAAMGWRPVESDLFFVCGGSQQTHYKIDLRRAPETVGTGTGSEGKA